MLNLFFLYQFVRKLAKPFVEWDAYKQGIIDENGKVLKKRKELSTSDEKAAFSAFDLMVLNLKKLIEKVPGGKSRLASYAAALYLLREWNHFTENSMLTEEVNDEDIIESSKAFEPILIDFIDKSNYITTENYVNQKMTDLESFFEDAPTNSAGSGAIAGIGIGPDGEPGLTPAQRLRYIAKNKRRKKRNDI